MGLLSASSMPADCNDTIHVTYREKVLLGFQLPHWSYKMQFSLRTNKSRETWRLGDGRLELNITQRQKHLFLPPQCCLF